jgi:hypothetical protein
MKLTRDMAIFDDNLPFGVKLLGYALGFTLKIAVLIDRMISAFFFSIPYYKPGSRQRSPWLKPQRLKQGK